MADNMNYQDVFKCNNCGLETDENYIGCPECKEFGTIKFEKSIAVGPCQCDSCIKMRERESKHINHPFYDKARKEWLGTQSAQIMKGAEKYPEPFTPSSWSNEQLAEHAIQENVDQLHYIVGMKERMEEQRKEIAALEKKYDSKFNEYEFLFEQTGKQQEKIIQYKREIERLEGEAKNLRDENYKVNTLLRGLNE